jgi:hypothetical protein
MRAGAARLPADARLDDRFEVARDPRHLHRYTTRGALEGEVDPRLANPRARDLHPVGEVGERRPGDGEATRRRIGREAERALDHMRTEPAAQACAWQATG